MATNQRGSDNSLVLLPPDNSKRTHKHYTTIDKEVEKGMGCIGLKKELINVKLNNIVHMKYTSMHNGDRTHKMSHFKN